jgi:hypothetical protein
MDNHQELEQLITLFLQINSNPSDQQFHSLAFAIGLDHETLESVAYEMLAKEEKVTAESTHYPVGIEVGNICDRLIESGLYDPEEQTTEEDVLDGEYDPRTTSYEDILLNDGAPEGTSTVEMIQQSLLNDGVSEENIGLDLDDDKEAMYDDGVGPHTNLPSYS